MAVDVEGGTAAQTSDKKANVFHVKVVDHNKPGQPAVNITMPIGVVKFGLKMAKNFAPKMKDVDLDWDSIAAMIQEGMVGPLVHVEDEAEHKTIDVWTE